MPNDQNNLPTPPDKLFLTPEKLATLRALGYGGDVKDTGESFTPLGSDEAKPIYTPDLDKDLAVESTPQIEKDAKALQVSKQLIDQQPTSDLLSSARELNNPLRAPIPEKLAADTDPGLAKSLLAKFDPSKGGYYPNGANGFGAEEFVAPKDPNAPLITPPAPVSVATTSKALPKHARTPMPTRAPAVVKDELAQAMLGQVNPMHEINVDGSSINNMEGLSKALQQQNQMVFQNQIGKAADKMLAGVLGQKPMYQDIYDQGIQQAGQIPTQYAAMAAQEENDPTSNQSDAFRQFLKGFGYNVNGNVSASLAQKLLPSVFKQYEAQQAAEAKKDITAQTLAQRLQSAQEHNDTMRALATIAANAKRDVADTRAGAQSGAFQNKLNEQDIKHETDALNNLQKNKTYTAINDHAKTADQIRDLVTSATTNPAAAASIPTELGLFLSRGQRLHTSTIDAFKNGGNNAVMQRIKQMYQTGSGGTLTPENAQNLLSLINQEQAGAEKTKAKLEQEAATNYKRISGKMPRWFSPEENTDQAPQYSKDVLDYAQTHGITPDQANAIKLQRTQGK